MATDGASGAGALALEEGGFALTVDVVGALIAYWFFRLGKVDLPVHLTLLQYQSLLAIDYEVGLFLG